MLIPFVVPCQLARNVAVYWSFSSTASPRFDVDGESKLRMPRADEAFDWGKIRERLEERSVLVFFDSLPVLPMPERIVEESDAPPR